MSGEALSELQLQVINGDQGADEKYLEEQNTREDLEKAIAFMTKITDVAYEAVKGERNRKWLCFKTTRDGLLLKYTRVYSEYLFLLRDLEKKLDGFVV